jgi:hypothetical protein
MENKLNQTAIESYSVKITKRLSDDFFQKNLVITGNQILNFTPIEQINLFVISNLFDKWKEETSKLKSPYFDFEHADVNAALKTFMNVLSKHISIRRADFDPLLRNAIANALCLTLAPYLFLKENYFSFETPIIQMADFKERVKFLRINKAITDAFIRKIEKHNLTSTPLSYALDYLNESYKEVASDLVDAEEIIQEISKLEPVSIEQLVFMFKPKAEVAPTLVPETPVLKKEEPVNPTPKVESTIIDTETETTTVESPALQNEVIETPELFIPEPATKIEVQNEVFMEIVINEPDKVEVIAASQIEETITQTPKESAADQINATLNDLLKPQNKKLTVLDKANQNKLTDLKSAITINQKFMFVNELFKGESKVFQEALEKVDSCITYNEAINLLLESYANRYDWDTDKEEVAEFFELISRKFVTE